ncbi:MAG: sugar transferase [Candidatus Rokubacteria bacterium]|nr:sugar transferase [Candidatus Rokubacteria bacterium]
MFADHTDDFHSFRVTRSLAGLTSRLAPALGVAFTLLGTLYALSPNARVAVAGLLIGAGLLLLLRAVSDRVPRARPRRERVLIVGTGPVARKLIEEIEARPCCRYTIVGVVDEATASAEAFRHLLLGRLERLGKIIGEVHPDRIIVALAEQRGRLPVRELLAARVRAGIVVEDAVEVYERLTGKLAIESLTPSSLIFSRDFRKSRVALVVGRGLSILAALIGLVGLAPLLGLIVLAIKLDSRGPVFFVQERVGLRGRRFKLIKFRTMHPADRATSEWVQDNVDRITRAGRWLRKFRLDELPQFANILHGDMNLVGPRPHPVSNYELFVLVHRNLNDISGQEIPYYSLRSAVRPGVTGWAQIRYGYANNLAEETEKMRYDLYYIKHMSLWLDLRIVFETVRVILLGHGAEAAAASRREVPAGTGRQRGLAALSSAGGSGSDGAGDGGDPKRIGARVAGVFGARRTRHISRSA